MTSPNRAGSNSASPNRASSASKNDWQALSAQASLASHRLVGWIYWDPDAIARYANLGIENGMGYYIATRCAPLASVGDEVVIAACYSIHGDFIRLALKLAREKQHLKMPIVCETKQLFAD